MSKLIALTWEESKQLAAKKGADPQKVHLASIWLERDVEAGNDSQMLKEFNKGEWEVWQDYSVRMNNQSHPSRTFPAQYYERA